MQSVEPLDEQSSSNGRQNLSDTCAYEQNVDGALVALSAEAGRVSCENKKSLQK
jgi:hypothetical protein